jgi:2,3-bisphosphoglycerate-independent phosphoglycerate mutase
MADRPDEFEDGKTPLELARTPVVDELARGGEVGTVVTVPADVAPGSDVANMAIMGLDPREHRVGRAALEAAGRGVALDDDEIVFRANYVTVSAAPEDGGVLEDYSGGGLSDNEAAPLAEKVTAVSAENDARFVRGVGYRNLMVFRDPDHELDAVHCTPPHDIQGQRLDGHLPKDELGEAVMESKIVSVMLKLFPELNEESHRRQVSGGRAANWVWLWGQGRRAELPKLADRFGVTGAVISAVDLVRGLGRATGMDVIEVEGATGDLDTNFAGKGEAAVNALEDHEVVFVHVEAPDEASHRGEPDAKRSAIEAVDREVLARVHGRAKERGDTRVLVLPDHLTPLSIRTHAHGEVPFVLWGPGIEPRPAPAFTEREAAKTGVHVERGWELLGRALGTN